MKKGIIRREAPKRLNLGKHRKKLRRKFHKKKYHRRSIIENMWFCIKGLCGKVIYAKK